MSYQVLARKWRPKNFNEMVGQAHVLRALINALDQQRLHHAYLFTGTRGVGKTTLARILAKSLNCLEGISSTPCGVCSACASIDEGRFVDLIEVDAASRTKVEDTREILDNVQYAPTQGRYKVYLIDEVHMLSNHSFNALLKTLEEPPEHVKFLLATTDPQKLPATILSRCLQFNLTRMPADTISAYLTTLLDKEAINYEPHALKHLAQAADGSMRDALSLLDQAIAYGQGNIHTQDVMAMLGYIERDYIFNILQALDEQSASQLMQCVQNLSERVSDFAVVFDALISTLHQLSVSQLVPEAIDDITIDSEQLSALAKQFSPETLQLYYQIALHGKRDLIYCADQRSGFEMTLLRMLAFQPKPSKTSHDIESSQNIASAGISPTEKKTQVAATNIAAEKNHIVQDVTARNTHSEANAHTTNKATKSVTPSSVSSSSSSTAAKLPLSLENWPAIMHALPLNGITAQFAENAAAKAIENKDNKQIVTMSLAKQHSLLEKHASKLEKLLSDYCSTLIILEVNIVDEVVESPAVVKAKVQQEKLAQAKQSISDDPIVQSLQEHFQASIVDASVEALK